jgi:hypothetical protein
VSTAVAVVLLLAVVAYAVFGGADFGGPEPAGPSVDAKELLPPSWSARL